MTKVATLAQLRDRLKRPLQRELAEGCQDAVVVGGIEKLVTNLGAPFAEVRALVAGYRDLAPDEREARLRQALALLEAVPEPPPDGEVLRKGGEVTAPLQLDQGIASRSVDIGHQAAKKLSAIDLKSYRDLLQHYPRRYEDRRILPYFSALQDQQTVTVAGTITGRKAVKSKRGMTVLRVFLEDALGARLSAVWFNQPWLEAQLYPGQRLIVSGKVKRFGRQIDLQVAHHEIDDDKAAPGNKACPERSEGATPESSESLSSGRIVGIYPSTQGLSQAYLRRAVYRLLEALETVPDHLPRSVLERHELIPLDTALREVHFPSSEVLLGKALRRLKFDEFLFLELRVLLNRDTTLLGKHFAVREQDLKTFQESLPFTLTKAQQRALREILDDMAKPRQMARLLQGDVGSGKTAVAAAAIYVAVKNGYQAALMAPTEILARQHYLNLLDYLYPLGVRCELLLGTLSGRERNSARARIASGEADLVVGTHALIQEGVEFNDLGLAVIDEEHRFGVEQRRRLIRGLPDVLVMSATPIPRSLALTYYGDLELTVIDELPPGRKPVTTRLVVDARRREVYRFAWGEILKGRQVYVVAPLIEESEALTETVSATRLADDLRAMMPERCRIELLHGKLGGDEKESVMERFRRHDFDLLVSTTVIEVGVDIPNASLMIIENAERFGLSQLHQLRGRVGRGEHESYCIMIAGDRSKKTQHRLEVIEKYSDGFIIAEKDLELRGPGELRGTRQSGMPDLVLGDLAQDGEIIEQARDLAKRMLEADPKLEAAWAERLRAELQRRSAQIGFRELI
jgi:ATP-dependent DNA helicase RecG